MFCKIIFEQICRCISEFISLIEVVLTLDNIAVIASFVTLAITWRREKMRERRENKLKALAVYNNDIYKFVVTFTKLIQDICNLNAYNIESNGNCFFGPTIPKFSIDVYKDSLQKVMNQIISLPSKIDSTSFSILSAALTQKIAYTRIREMSVQFAEPMFLVRIVEPLNADATRSAIAVSGKFMKEVHLRFITIFSDMMKKVEIMTFADLYEYVSAYSEQIIDIQNKIEESDKWFSWKDEFENIKSQLNAFFSKYEKSEH